MRVKVLAHAVAEAERFIEAARMLDREAIQKVEASGRNNEFENWYEGGQYTAAVKRASMDLTRALAKVRK